MTRFFNVINQSITVVARDAAGAAVTGKIHSDFTIAYRKGVAGAMVDVTPVTLAAITTAHTDGGVKELNATTAPGAYRVDLPDAAFTSGAGESITVHCTATGALVMTLEVELVDQVTVASGAVVANVTHFGGVAGTFASGRPDVNMTHIAGSAVSASTAQLGVNVVNAAGTAWASGAITAAVIATGAIDADAIADNAIDAGAIASSAITSAKIATGAITTATFAAGAINAAAIAADAITDAKVASDVTIASVTGAVGSVTGAVGSVTGNVGGSVASVTAGVTVTTNNDKTGYGLSASAVQAIWDALTSALTTVGSIGKLLVDNINATIGSRLASASYTTPPTVGAIADQVWEEALADHSGTSGSTAAALNAAGSAGDPWSTALPGAYGNGTAGKIIGDNINATVSSRLAGASYTAPPSAATNATAVRTELSTELGRMDAAVSTRATPVQVNAEVVDALATDTYAEPAAPPAATASLKDKIGWTAALARNKVTQTATTQTLRNDADNANIGTSTVSDDGTVLSKGEWV